MVLIGGVSLAIAEEMVPNYTKDGAGSVVKDISGECVRTSNENTTDKLVECGYPEKVLVTKELVAAPTAATVTTTVADVINISAK